MLLSCISSTYSTTVVIYPLVNGYIMFHTLFHFYRRNEGVLAVRSYGHWHEQCITDDYTDVDYHSLCRALGFRHAVGIKKAVGTNVDFENFMVVQLNAGTDVLIRSATKDILQRRTDLPCNATYVLCSST